MIFGPERPILWTLSTNTVLGTGVESMTFGSVAEVGDVDCLMT